MSDYTEARCRLETPDLSIYDCVCRYPYTRYSETHTVSRRQLHLPREGVCVVKCGGRELFMDPNQVFAFEAGDRYQIRHLACGRWDCGTAIVIGDALIDQIGEALGLDRSDAIGDLFHVKSLPATAEVSLAHYELVAACDEDELDPMAGEELACTLLEVVVRGWLKDPARPEPPGTRDREIANRVKILLAGRLCEGGSLASLAEEVECSRFHLTRAFHRATGSPVHRYLLSLRIKEAVRRLAHGESDLSALAYDLGFSSHSHFTSVFRRELGLTPSGYRGRLASGVS
jgi:AraC-like DNA-binding protein